MLRKLIVHIGANKTGSSAVQRFLAMNCAALRAHGLLVPDQDCGLSKTSTGWQTFYFQELFSDPRGQETLEKAIETIEKRAPDAHTLLLSAESLAANAAAPPLFKRIASRYETRLLFYVRRQDEYLLSAWQQWYSKQSSDFWAWLVRSLGDEGNWRNYLQRWEEVFPREHIMVRIYDRSKLVEADVVQDYLASVGIIPHEDYKYSDVPVNLSFSEPVLDLVAGNQFIFENVHDNKFYNFVQRITGDRFIKSGSSSAITHAQRKAILDVYEPCNNWVSSAYFPQSTEPLFKPLREGDYVYVPQDVLEKQKMEFLICMLYGMYRDRNA